MTGRGRAAASALLCVGLVLVAGGCGGDGEDRTRASRNGTAQDADGGNDTAIERARAVEDAVARWAQAATLMKAKAGAEAARNLITGPTVQGAGDADGDGRATRVRVGLLPGDDGSPGLATAVEGGCVLRDVLGGSWDRPKERWGELLTRIEEWSATNNRFPELPSHAQRTAGWATLTLSATSIEEAREYAGHAVGHAAIVTQALRAPAARPCPGG